MWKRCFFLWLALLNAILSGAFMAGHETIHSAIHGLLAACCGAVCVCHRDDEEAD